MSIPMFIGAFSAITSKFKTFDFLFMFCSDNVHDAFNFSSPRPFSPELRLYFGRLPSNYSFLPSTSHIHDIAFGLTVDVGIHSSLIGFESFSEPSNENTYNLRMS